MVIGIDFDDTCVNTWELIKKRYQEYYPSFTVDLPENSPWDKEKIIMANHYKEMCEDIEIYEGLPEFLDYCHKKKIKVYLITARGGDIPEIIEPTKAFLKRNHLEFDYCFFDIYIKGPLCQMLGVNLMIDDSKKVLDEVEKYGVKTLRFGIKDNHHDYALSWHNALKYLKEMGELNENS